MRGLFRTHAILEGFDALDSARCLLRCRSVPGMPEAAYVQAATAVNMSAALSVAAILKSFTGIRGWIEVLAVACCNSVATKGAMRCHNNAAPIERLYANVSRTSRRIEGLLFNQAFD